MTMQDIEDEGYKLKSLMQGKFVRNAKRLVILRKHGRNYAAWSFDLKNYTVPMVVKL